MMDLPAFERLRATRSVLLLGAGGGYDILGAVPLFVALRAQGKTVHLGGVSFTSLDALPGCRSDDAHACLFPVRGESAVSDRYCPEPWLARWLSAGGHDQPIWALAKVGVRPLRAALADLVARLAADAVVLVDGGVDILLRGDETSIGTPAEDLASLCAVSGLDVPTRLIMCLGFGAEIRDGIPHAQVLERVADLQEKGGYLGAVSLHPRSGPGAAYLEALAFVGEGQRGQRGSHVQGTVRAAMLGQFGSTRSDTWVSALTALCWFFSVAEVARSHLFLSHLEPTETMWDVTARVRGCRSTMAVRERSSIPL
jgi:hypothetical protein